MSTAISARYSTSEYADLFHTRCPDEAESRNWALQPRIDGSMPGEYLDKSYRLRP